MFAGNDDSGGWAAVMYSLIRSCELNGVEPWRYLRDVLSRLAEGVGRARAGGDDPTRSFNPSGVGTAAAAPKL